MKLPFEGGHLEGMEDKMELIRVKAWDAVVRRACPIGVPGGEEACYEHWGNANAEKFSRAFDEIVGKSTTLDHLVQGESLPETVIDDFMSLIEDSDQRMAA